MFGTFLTSIVTLIQLYVFWRISSIPVIKNRVPKIILIGTGLILWGIFSLGRFYGHGGAGTFSSILELIGMSWLGILFLISVSLFAVDVVTGFGFFLPRFAPSLRGWGLIAGCILSVIALIQGLRPPVVQDYKVYLSGLSAEMDGTVLVGMSDLHIGSLISKQWLEARVAQVQAQKPDIIVLLGDIVEGHGISENELVPVLKNLSAPLGVFVVAGNHENHGRDAANTLLFENAGFKVLRNSWIELRPGLILSGVSNLSSNTQAGYENGSIPKALANRPSGATILLSHMPLQAETASNAGVNLMLSGHTHGGQIWPFNYIVKRRFPLIAGEYKINEMTVIVCRGTGTWGPRMRLWFPGEILRVTLYK